MTKVLPNRSYEIKSDGQYIRRNRRHLRLSNHQQPVELADIFLENCETVKPDQLSAPEQMTDLMNERTSKAMTQKTVTRSGREVKEPLRFKDFVKK